MPSTIRDMLHRRTDLSTFVVHLTRSTGDMTARQVLDEIVRARTLKAGAPQGWLKGSRGPADPLDETQRVVCFSETPLEHVHAMAAEIEGRAVKLEPYGVAFTKLVARRSGINPVWYVDMTPGRDWVIKAALDGLRNDALAHPDVGQSSFARIAPFIDHMGTWPTTGTRKEFWWEREWRHVGDLRLPESGLLWLCPEDEITEFKEAAGPTVGPVVDPRWGLEQIVASLAGFAMADVSPFAALPAPPIPGFLLGGDAPF